MIFEIDEVTLMCASSYNLRYLDLGNLLTGDFWQCTISIPFVSLFKYANLISILGQNLVSSWRRMCLNPGIFLFTSKSSRCLKSGGMALVAACQNEQAASADTLWVSCIFSHCFEIFSNKWAWTSSWTSSPSELGSLPRSSSNEFCDGTGAVRKKKVTNFFKRFVG